MNIFEDCPNCNIARMVFYFHNREDYPNSVVCEIGLKNLSEIIGTDDVAIIDSYREQLMDEAAARYSALYGLYYKK